MKPTVVVVVPPPDDKNSDGNESGRTRTNLNDKSKAARRRAERPAFTTVRGIYHRPLPGLSVPERSVGALKQEQPSWIERREQVETWHGETGSSAPLQSEENREREDREDPYKILDNLTERERLMHQATQADEERGAVRVIKCKL